MKDCNHGGDRILLIRKVWSGKEPLHQDGAIKRSPGLGARLRQVASKFPHISSDSHDDEDEHAKLLLLTSKSLALLDPQHDSSDSHPVHYSVPLHHISDDVEVEDSIVVIEYLASLHPSASRVSKGFGGVAKVFGILSPLSPLPQTPERRPSSAEDDRDEDDTVVMHARMQAASVEEAQDIAENISLAIKRLKQSMEFLDYGFPFPQTSAAVEKIIVGKNRIVGDMPDVNEKIVVEGGEDEDLGIVVSSPMGVCTKTLSVGELAKSCGGTKVLRIHPVQKNEKNAVFHSVYAVDVRYSVEKLPSACERRMRTRVSSVPVELIVGGGAGVLLLIMELAGFSRMLGVVLLTLGLSIGMRLLYITERVQRYVMWYTCVQIVEVKSAAPSEHRLHKGVSLRRCITLQQSMVHGRNGAMLNDKDALSMISDDQRKVSPQELVRLQEMNQISPAINVDLFMRYIKACRGDRELALQRLYDTAEWRQMNNVDTILDREMPYFRDLKEHYVHSVIGRSKSGLPVVVEGMGGFRQTMVALRGKGIIPYHKDEVMKQFTYVIEWITRVLEPSDFPRGQFIRIYDMKGIRLSDVGDHEAVQLGKDMMDVLEQYYPERMAKAYVVNCPKFFAALWSVVKPLLDPQTANKITLVSRFKNILPALRNDLDDDVIPKVYGGNGVENWYDSKEEKEIFALAAQKQHPQDNKKNL